MAARHRRSRQSPVELASRRPGSSLQRCLRSDAAVAGLPADREILERTVRAIADRAADAYRLVEEVLEVDPRDESGLVASAKRLRMELLQTKASSNGRWGRSSSTAGGATTDSLGQRRRAGARTLGSLGTSAERTRAHHLIPARERGRSLRPANMRAPRLERRRGALAAHSGG
jgi:hypothetical protein